MPHGSTPLPSSPPVLIEWRLPELALAAFFLVLFGLGGGGSPDPIPELAVELAALPLIGWRLASPGRLVAAFAADRALWWLLLAALLLPLLQLVPLPPEVWRALPGRAAEAETLRQTGLGLGWRPFTSSPDLTIASVLSLLPAIAVLLWTAGWSPRRRFALVALITAAAVVSAILGLVQFSAGPGRSLSLFSYVHTGFATGVFANRNAHADLAVIGLFGLLTLWWSQRERIGLAGFIAAALLLAAAVPATGSRAGLALLALPLLALVWTIRSSTTSPAIRARLIGVTVAGVAVLAAALVVGGTALDRSFARFDAQGDARTDLWANSLPVAQAYAPWGAGMGSFVPAYAALEPLASVSSTHANRAHNDYLELAIESGGPGLLLLLALTVLLAWRVRDALNSPDPWRRRGGLFAGGALIVLALHSVVDYPLRNLILLTVAAGGCALLLRPVPTPP